MIVTNERKPPASAPHLSEAGFSLIELLLSIVAAVVILGAVLSASLYHASERKTNAALNLALVACTNNLEEMRTLPFGLVPTMDGVGFDVPGINGAPGGLQPVSGDADGLPGEISVTVDKSSGGTILYLVKASVIWTGAIGRQRVEMECLLGDRR